MKKILVLDGISGVSLGKDMCSAIDTQRFAVSYCDLSALDTIPFYALRSAIAKVKRKQKSRDSFYALPKKRWHALLKKIDDDKPDIILVIGFVYRFVSPERLKQIADRYNCKLFLYDTDSCNFYPNRREFIYFVETETRCYDGVFSFSKVMTDFLKRQQIPAKFAPFGSNIIHSHVTTGPYQQDVLFVGSGDLRRIFMLEHIVDKVTVIGSRWERNSALMSNNLRQKVINKTVWGEELYKQLRSSKIVLNITRGPFYAAETGINLRIFEALAAGCFVLTDYCDEIAELFEIGVELETFKGSAELIEKVDFYLKNDVARIAIAERGHKKLLENFSWEHRTADMLSMMEEM